MTLRYEYARKVWHCTLDPAFPICDLEGRCDECEYGCELGQLKQLVEEAVKDA